MFPKSIREALLTTFWCSWLILGLAYSAGIGQNSVGALGLLTLAALVSTLGLISQWAAGTKGPVDIWSAQRTLMKASDQPLPLTPTLTNGSILYLFLTMEELGEYAANLYASLNARWGGWKATHEQKQILDRLASVASLLESGAKRGRDELAVLERIAIPLSLGEALNLLDDCTDVAVTTAGIGLSSGLPVREGYAEVSTSNLTKRNPDTGKIDKHPDGKWIKGRNYKAPQLRQHLVGFYMRER